MARKSPHPPNPVEGVLWQGGAVASLSSRLANSHLQLCCLVDMVLGTGNPESALMNAKKIC